MVSEVSENEMWIAMVGSEIFRFLVEQQKDILIERHRTCTKAHTTTSSLCTPHTLTQKRTVSGAHIGGLVRLHLHEGPALADAIARRRRLLALEAHVAARIVVGAARRAAPVARPDLAATALLRLLLLLVLLVLVLLVLVELVLLQQRGAKAHAGHACR